MINLVACVANVNGKLFIGKNNGLLIENLKEDKLFFKNLTKNCLHGGSKLKYNVVVMGNGTFKSMGSKPLKDRYNFVLTRNETLLNLRVNNDKTVYYMTFEDFKIIYEKFTPNVFVIGGAEIYSLFLNDSNLVFKPKKLFITEITGYKKDPEPETVYTYMDPPTDDYKIIGYSQNFHQEQYTFRVLYYNINNSFKIERKYTNLLKTILKKGTVRPNRTGVDTIGIMGAQLRFNISNGALPLLTTKKVNIKGIIEELLFFCRGDTDTTILEQKGVNIWKGNTSREFLDSRNLTDYPVGEMGPMYGHSWRNYGGTYPNQGTRNGFDQLYHVENLLKTDPFSRRIYISNLNPKETGKMCLDMCHTYIQFYVEEINNVKYLSSYFTMRSSDFPIAGYYNICSYSILTQILALKCGMQAKEIVYNSVDCHIYENHIEQINEQLSRTPRPVPKIKLNGEIRHKDWADIQFSDFELIGYFPHPVIKMLMVV